VQTIFASDIANIISYIGGREAVLYLEPHKTHIEIFSICLCMYSSETCGLPKLVHYLFIPVYFMGFAVYCKIWTEQCIKLWL